VVAGRSPGSELADLAVNVGDGIWSLPLGSPVPELAEAHVLASVRDVQGNVTRVDRKFSTQASFLLSVFLGGGWLGSVQADVGGIDCGSVCEAAYGNGAAVQLAALPAYGGVVSGWSAACSGGAVTMSADVACSVTFAAAPCAGETNLTLSAATVTGVESHEACNSITAGSGYTVAGPAGDLTLTARQSIALGNGFAITGGAMRAGLDLMAAAD